MTTSDKTLWLVIAYPEGNDERYLIQGIFSTRERAIEACRDERHCVGPVELDDERPQGAEEWTGAFFPKAQEA